MASCTHSTSVQWGLAYPPLMSILSAMMFLMTVSSASLTSSLLLPLSAFLSFLSRPSDLAISVAWILEEDFRAGVDSYVRPVFGNGGEALDGLAVVVPGKVILTCKLKCSLAARSLRK